MRYLSVYIDFVERKQNRGTVRRYFLANKHRTGNVIRRLSVRQLNDDSKLSGIGVFPITIARNTEDDGRSERRGIRNSVFVE